MQKLYVVMKVLKGIDMTLCHLKELDFINHLLSYELY